VRLEIIKGTGELNNFSSATSGSGKTTETAKQKLEKYIDALKGMTSAQKSARDADKSLMKSRTSLADATLKLTDAQAYFNQVIAGYGANSQQAKDRQLALRKAQGAVERAGYDVEESIFAVSKAEKDLADVRLDPESSAQAIREAEINLAEAKLAVKDATESQVEATDALAEAETLLDEAVNGAKEGSDAYTEALDKLNDAKKAQLDATDAVTEAIERQTEAVDRLREAEEKAQQARKGVKPAAAAAAEALVNKPISGGVSGGIVDDLFSYTNEGGTNAFGLTEAQVQANLDAIDFSNIFPSGFTPFATGGIVTGPTRALIGEAGPEAVIPLDRLESGMTVNLTINAGMGTDPAKLGDEIVDVLTRYQRRNGALPLKVA
jgi:chromosome segregation ATPase